MSFPTKYKYIMIGAGIYGLSTAYHLAIELKKRSAGSGKDILSALIAMPKGSCTLSPIAPFRGARWN